MGARKSRRHGAAGVAEHRPGARAGFARSTASAPSEGKHLRPGDVEAGRVGTGAVARPVRGDATLLDLAAHAARLPRCGRAIAARTPSGTAAQERRAGAVDRSATRAAVATPALGVDEATGETPAAAARASVRAEAQADRSEEHTSELQS